MEDVENREADVQEREKALAKDLHLGWYKAGIIALAVLLVLAVVAGFIFLKLMADTLTWLYQANGYEWHISTIFHNIRAYLQLVK